MSGILTRKVEIIEDIPSDRVVETVILTEQEYLDQKFTLSSPAASQVFLTIPSGTGQIEGHDYEIVNSNEISWAGKALETSLEEGDTVIVIYNNE